MASPWERSRFPQELCVRIPRYFLVVSMSLGGAWACQGASSGGGQADGSGGEVAGDGAVLGKDGTVPAPEELELEENFRSPVVSGRYLWTANPKTNRVALIHAETASVRVMDGGHGPTFLAPLPGKKKLGGALVINTLGQDASIFRFGEDSGTETDIVQRRTAIQKGASAWAVGETGRTAIAWSRFQEDLLGALDGYQELTVLSLDDEVTSTELTAGYRPTQVVINSQETRAYVVSRPGISVIDLSSEPPVVAREIALPEDEATGARDVSLTPDGSLALVRVGRSAEILLVDTETGEQSTLTLPRQVTDLDLSADGTLAIAVMRGTPIFDSEESDSDGGGTSAGGAAGAGSLPSATESQIALLPVPAIAQSPQDLTLLSSSELWGSVVIAGDKSRALLFTSAVASSRLTVVDLQTLELRTIDVTAPIQAAFLSEEGSLALTVMTPPAGSSQAGAFALLDTEEDLPARIEGTGTVPRFVDISSENALLTTWGSETRPAEAFLGSFPELTVDRVELVSEPLASGMIPSAGKAYVAQAHPEGRVTFLDLGTGEPHTVTGFELASKVVD